MSIDLQPLQSETRSVPRTELGNRVHAERERIRAIVAAHGGSNVWVFGSVARGEDDEDSDLDLLVDLPVRTGILTLGAIAHDIERILGVEVDVVPKASLRPEYREVVFAEAIEK